MAEIEINALDKSTINAYTAGQAGVGLLFVHGMSGLNDTMRSYCDYYANKGYITLCPDMFAHQKTIGPENNTGPSDLYKNFDSDVALRDLLASVAHLRKTPGCGGKVGTIGFCFGARLAFLLSARSDINCAVGYDNLGLDSMLNDSDDIGVPVLLHFGDNNNLMPESIQQKIKSRLSRNENIRLESYPSAGHEFYIKEGLRYNPKYAKIAEEKTNSFLAENLLG